MFATIDREVQPTSQSNLDWLIGYLKAEMEEVSEMIIDRALDYEVDRDDLFSIDMEWLPDSWSSEDWENHNWDLSRWRCLKEILEKLEKQR